MKDYGEFCKSVGCEHFIEWDFEIERGEQPYPCESCEKVGQSYVVDDYPDDCPHLKTIQMITLDP